MDQDDPEKRIADLKRQRAEPVGQPPQFVDTQMVAGQQSLAHPGPGDRQDFGAPVGVTPQPAFPGEPDFGRRVGPLRQVWRFVIGLAAIGVVGLSLLFFGFAGYDFYAYRAGTPSTATIEHCTGFSHTRPRNQSLPVVGRIVPQGKSCTATWSVGGASYSGPIEGLIYRDRAGSSVDVRVNGGRAYTAISGVPSLITGALIVGLAILVVFFVWTGRRLRRIVSGVIDFFLD